MSDIENFFENPREEKKPRKKKEPKKKLALKTVLQAAGLVALVFSLGAAGYFYFQYKKAVSGTAASAQEETREILEKIGKVMELPSEEPTLATVADKEKLEGQAFFEKSENGDKVVIFPRAQKAILYRPATGKIVDMISLAPAPPAPAPSVAGEEKVSEEEVPVEEEKEVEIPKTFRVAVHNGSGKNGEAARTAEKIGAVSGVEITEKETAKKTYPRTLIIDLSGENSAALENIRALIGGEAGELPEGETKPEADILVIVGRESAGN